MSDDTKVNIISMIALAIVLAIVWFITSWHDSDIWNNGIHRGCGGNWVYEQAVGHRYTTNYLYHCDKCGATIEISDKR